MRQLEHVLQCLQANPDAYSDITQPLLQYRRGFCVQIESHVPRPAVSQILDKAASDFACLLVYGLVVGSDHTGIPYVPNTEMSHSRLKLEVISIGNYCACALTKEGTSPLCQKATMADVYHLQLSVSVRNLACIAMRKVGNWEPHYQTHRLAVQSPSQYSLVPGPC
uniref:Uncharacterized protein n=1 Tax=Moniliophthora roreri TaxID=221103 RepID=A0A0W0GCW0_MONRR